VSGDLGEGHPQFSPLGLYALSEGAGGWRRIVAKERRNRPETGRHRPGPILLPVEVGPSIDPHPLRRFPLEKAEFSAALLEMFAQGLGIFGIIRYSQGLKG